MQPVLIKTLLFEVFEYDLTRNKSESKIFLGKEACNPQNSY